MSAWSKSRGDTRCTAGTGSLGRHPKIAGLSCGYCAASDRRRRVVLPGNTATNRTEEENHQSETGHAVADLRGHRGYDLGCGYLDGHRGDRRPHLVPSTQDSSAIAEGSPAYRRAGSRRAGQVDDGHLGGERCSSAGCDRMVMIAVNSSASAHVGGSRLARFSYAFRKCALPQPNL